MAIKQKLNPPSIDYLLNLRREQEMLFRTDDMLIDAIRAVRTFTNQIQLDDKYRITDMEYHDSSLFDEIQRVANSLSLKEPKMKVKVRPAQGKAGEKNASNREEWTWRVLQDAGQMEAGHDAFKDMVDGACEGAAWSRLVFQNDLWEKRWSISADLADKEYDKLTEDAKKEAGQPFVWNVVDTRAVYPVFNGPILAEMLVITKVPRYQAFRQLRMKQWADGTIVPEELAAEHNVIDPTVVGPYVYKLEHWDDTYYTFAIQDQIIASYDNNDNAFEFAPGPHGRRIDQFEHGLERVPFFLTPGYVINWQHGRKLGWGIAESKRHLVEYKEYLMTLFAQCAARDVGKVLVRKRAKGAAVTSIGDNRQPQDKEYFEPFEIVTLEDGEDLTALDFGGGAEHLIKMIDYVQKEIDKLMAPRIAQDIGGGDPGSGFAIAQIITETEVREDHIVQNIQKTMHEMTEFIWAMVRNKVRETIWVPSDQSNDGWLGMGPEDLTAGTQFEWQLNPQRASADLVEHRDLHERMDKHTIGRRQAIEKMGDVNPEDVDEDIEIDLIEASPEYQKRFIALIMKELDRQDILYDAAEDVIQSGQLPGVGTAPGMQVVGPKVFPGVPGAGGEQQTPQGMGNNMVPDMGNLAARNAQGPMAITSGQAGAAMGQQPGGPSGAGAIIPR